MREGAEIRTCCEAVASRRSRTATRFATSSTSARGAAIARASSTRPLSSTARVEAKIVVLAAGTFGSTRLLLGNRATLPGLSPALGRRFSSNGDMLSVARNCREPGGRRRERRWRYLDPSRGPVITTSARPPEGRPAICRCGSRTGVGRRSASGCGRRQRCPPTCGGCVASRFAARSRGLRGRRRTRLGADLARVLGSARSSAGDAVLLSLGCDVPGGRLRLRGDDAGARLEPERRFGALLTTRHRTLRVAWPERWAAGSDRACCCAAVGR